jgi:hypothetical protein
VKTEDAGKRLLSEPAARVGALPTASGAITRLAYAHAKEAGLELEPLLKKAGLTVHQIEDPGVRLRVRDQIRFLNLVAIALKDDFLGFHLAQSPDLREMGWLYYVSASSETMGEALQRAARYSSIVNEGVSLKYIDRGDNTVITIDYFGVSRHLDRHQIEFLIVTLVRICRQLTGLHLMPTRVRFVHHRESCSAFAEFFGRDSDFGAAVDEVAFATTIKNMPVVSADPYLNKLLVARFEQALSYRPTNQSSFRSSVENTIALDRQDTSRGSF